ncbi:MAG TPA: circularly permuted type 2 ATP-grasp protein [Pararobbsia sp.]|nr:circularly permuted type 2 ATP-grasp protein [Pararobbsia sp.]
MAFQSSLPFEPGVPHADALPLRALPVRDGHWDELREDAATLREPWQRFFELLGEHGYASLGARADAVRKQVRDNDITYNVYADKGNARAWALDLLPFLIDEREWRMIERGVAQRARLLNAIIGDVYGSQTLLRDGLIPPALVFGHPGYLRPVKGYTPPDGQYLQLVAVDLARNRDGEWTVLSQRTEAPSGLGYSLENRLIVSDIFAEAFREMRVPRLASSYSRLIGTLAQLATHTMRGSNATGHPHIALLTPGPYSETYFEHVFLARYLGITLAEGKDLTVRDDVLYLKTLAGLERVHVLLRRLDDAFCDPVELRPDSTIGVPGLLQVMRAGNVAVSNVPGSGFVESTAMHAFLPAISERLLGQSLVLPSVPTWWCGEAAARVEALSTLEHGYVMPTWPGRRDGRPLGMEQGVQRLDAWREEIASAPEAFTIQAPMPLSCAPRFDDGLLDMRPAVVRCYAIGEANGNWHVMPGGFTRFAAERQAAVSMQLGGSSVDTWILSSEPASSFSLMPARPTPADLSRKHRTISSRAAENLFWSGRYGERAENSVRLCRMILGSLESDDSSALFATLVELARRSGLVPPPEPEARSTLRDFEQTLIASLDESSPWPSVGHNLAGQAQASGEVRGRLSSDHWRTIVAARNDFRDALRRLAPRIEAGQYNRLEVIAALEKLAVQLTSISGAQGDRMTRDEAWRLLFVGRHIERIASLAAFLRAAAAQQAVETHAGFDLLLELFDSTLTYRSLYPGRFQLLPLLDLIVVEPTNPRSLYGVYGRLITKLDDLPTPAAQAQRAPLSSLLPPASSFPALEALCEPDAQGQYTALVQLCDRLGALMMALSNEISARYFSHANASHAWMSA